MLPLGCDLHRNRIRRLLARHLQPTIAWYRAVALPWLHSLIGHRTGLQVAAASCSRNRQCQVRPQPSLVSLCVGAATKQESTDNLFLITERRPSPGLSINLSSNNPFRNRAASPSLQSPASLQDRSSSGSRPMSRNPFLSTFEAEFNKEAKKTDNLIDMSASMKDSPKKATFGTATEELFVRPISPPRDPE